MTNEEIIHQSAKLRGKYQFRQAIDLVKNELPNFNPDSLIIAYLEMLYAAKEAGFKEEASLYREKLLEIDPELPL